MPAPVKTDVQGLLAPHHERIRGVIDRAWSEVRSVAKLRADAGFSPTLYSRTTATDMFDAIARHAISEFGSDPVVKLKVESQTIKLIFRSIVIARFKKGDANKLGRNIATQAAMAFVNVDGTLPGIPPEAAKVEFIWVPNELQTKIEKALVVARDGNKLLWDYELAQGSDGSIVVPLPPTVGPDMDDDDLVTPKAVPKPVAK